MNPEEVLQSVSQQLLKVAATATGKVHVLYNNKIFEVVQSAVYTVPIKPIASFKAEAIRTGLTVEEWAALRRIIARAIKGEK